MGRRFNEACPSKTLEPSGLAFARMVAGGISALQFRHGTFSPFDCQRGLKLVGLKQSGSRMSGGADLLAEHEEKEESGAAKDSVVSTDTNSRGR